VVRGKMPAHSLYAGNPGRVGMKLLLYEKTFYLNKLVFSLDIDGIKSDQGEKYTFRKNISLS
jgi:hypothetical protein